MLAWRNAPSLLPSPSAWHAAEPLRIGKTDETHLRPGWSLCRVQHSVARTVGRLAALLGTVSGCGVLPTITVQGRRGRTQEPKERLAGTGPQLPDRPFRIFSLPHFPPSFCASSTPFSPLPFPLFSPHPLCSLCPSAPLAPVFLISPTPRLLPSPCPQSTSSLQPMSVALPLSLPHASLHPRGS